MYVCICNGVTDREIRAAVGRGARRLEDLSRELGVATGCGSCACAANELLSEAPAPSASHAGPRQSLPADA